MGKPQLGEATTGAARDPEDSTNEEPENDAASREAHPLEE
jgi:hypothetical protein